MVPLDQMHLTIYLAAGAAVNNRLRQLILASESENLPRTPPKAEATKILIMKEEALEVTSPGHNKVNPLVRLQLPR